MDGQYEKNVKWIKIAAYVVGLGFIGLGVANYFLKPEKDWVTMGAFILLGLANLVIMLGLSTKMGYDLENEKNKHPEDHPDEIEHDIGF